jgi:hypothetical protein
MLRRLGVKSFRRSHLLVPCLLLALVAVILGLSHGGLITLWLTWVCGLSALGLLLAGGDADFGKAEAQQRVADEFKRDRQKVAEEGREKIVKSRLNPPVWPPRKPDNWGWEIQERHRIRMEEHRYDVALGRASASPPIMPIIPSWEEYHQREQADDPLQIRWATDAAGEWVKVVWGNRSLIPTDNGPLPVFQSMQRVETGEWVWIRLGRNVTLDWQNGPPRMVEINVKRGDSTTRMRRPLGSPKHQDAPAPLAPDGGHGDARFRGADDLEAGGFVPPR